MSTIHLAAEVTAQTTRETLGLCKDVYVNHIFNFLYKKYFALHLIQFPFDHTLNYRQLNIR